MKSIHDDPVVKDFTENLAKLKRDHTAAEAQVQTLAGELDVLEREAFDLEAAHRLGEAKKAQVTAAQSKLEKLRADLTNAEREVADSIGRPRPCRSPRSHGPRRGPKATPRGVIGRKPSRPRDGGPRHP